MTEGLTGIDWLTDRFVCLEQNLAMSPSPRSSFSSNYTKNMGEERRSAVEADCQESLRSEHNMGRFSDSLMRGLSILRYEEASGKNPASMILSFVVTEDLCNDFHTLHGGAQATAVDVFTSILLHTVNPVPSVTTDLHVSYVSAAPVGSTVICVCTADKHSGALQFSSCDLYREVAGNPPSNQRRQIMVAKGLHSKYVLKKKRIKGFDGEKPRSKL